MAAAKNKKNTASSSKKNSRLRKISKFELVTLKYGLTDPEQIKTRILWLNLQALILGTFGDTPDTRAKLSTFQNDWKACEQQSEKKFAPEIK